MRNFTIILLIFFILFLIGSLFIADPLLLFIMIFLAFLISFICLIKYLGALKGLISALALIVLPFLIEYILYLIKIPYFQSPLIKSLSFKNIYVPITISNLFTIFTLPLIFICSLFFAHKTRLFANIKAYNKTFLTIFSSLLVGLTFLNVKQNTADYSNFLKWLIIALLVNALILRLYKFKSETLDLYKEAPIVIYLAIYGLSALKQMNSFNLIIAAILTIIYLSLLYNEYKYGKISQRL
jgi:hypothetical protein